MVCTALVIVFKILTEKKHIPLYVNTDAWQEQQTADLEAANRQKNKKKEIIEAPSILSDDADSVTLGSEDENDNAEDPADSDIPEEPAETTETTDSPAEEEPERSEDSNTSDSESEDE